MVVFLLLILFLIINVKKKPFNLAALNDCETMSLITSMISIYCGVFFISDMTFISTVENPETYRPIDNGLRLSPVTSIIMFILIVASNSLFILYWMCKMWKEIKGMLRLKCKGFYLFCCLCNKQHKYQKEVE